MKLTQELINEYISSKESAWSPTSQRSEKYRLQGLLGCELSNPADVYKELSTRYSPYTLKTIFIRLGELAVYQGLPNIFKSFMDEKKKLFQNVYKREFITVNYEDVVAKISTIEDQDVRQAATVLLTSGLRAHELQTVEGVKVLGKGLKERVYFGPKDIPQVSYLRLYRGLRSVGLKPHMLRKLFATKLAAAGFKPEDLCKVLGWSSFETAKFYLQPKTNSELQLAIQGALAK